MLLSEIKLNPKNPRFIKDDKFKSLAKSIKKSPRLLELKPIVIDDNNNMILAGNQRYKALLKLGYTEVPEPWIKRAKDFSPEELKEYILKDNISWGEFDIDALADEYELEDLLDWGLDDLKELNNNELIETVNSGDENSEWATDMPEFEESEKKIKLILCFETELERENYAKENKIQVTHKMNNQWVSCV